MTETIIVLDFGSQYSQLIARRVREAQVYCELLPWDAPEAEVLSYSPKGFILSGGPRSVYDPGAPFLPEYVLTAGAPILGICYGMQVLTHALGGRVAPAGKREYGPASFDLVKESSILKQEDNPQVWMSHGDRIEQPPAGFTVLATTGNSPVGSNRRFGAGLLWIAVPSGSSAHSGGCLHPAAFCIRRLRLSG